MSMPRTANLSAFELFSLGLGDETELQRTPQSLLIADKCIPLPLLPIHSTEPPSTWSPSASAHQAASENACPVRLVAPVTSSPIFAESMCACYAIRYAKAVAIVLAAASVKSPSLCCVVLSSTR